MLDSINFSQVDCSCHDCWISPTHSSFNLLPHAKEIPKLIIH